MVEWLLAKITASVHDLAVMGLNPGRAEHGVHRTSESYLISPWRLHG